MTMGRINNNGVGTSLNEGVHAFHRVGCHTHASGYAQTALAVLAGHGLVLSLGDVFISNESDEASVFVHHGEFLNFVFLKNQRGGSQVGLLSSGHEVFACHHFLHQLVEVSLKAQVAVGHDTHQVLVVVHHGDTADMVFGHQCQCIAYGASALNSHGVVNHTIFGTLDDGHLSCLFLNAHILVNHTDTTLASDGNSHGRFGHGVHGGGDERDVEVNVA